MGFNHDELAVEAVTQFGKCPQDQLRATTKAEAFQAHENDGRRAYIRVFGYHSEIVIVCEQQAPFAPRNSEHRFIINTGRHV